MSPGQLLGHRLTGAGQVERAERERDAFRSSFHRDQKPFGWVDGAVTGAEPWGSLSRTPQAPCGTPGPPGPGTAWASVSGRRTRRRRPPSASSAQAARARVHAPAPAGAGRRLHPDVRSPSFRASRGPEPRLPRQTALLNPDTGFNGDQRPRPFRERLLAPSWSAARRHRPFMPADPSPREGRGAALPPRRRRKRGRTSPS